MFVRFKNIFHKKDEYGSESTNGDPGPISDFNKQTFTLGRKSRNCLDNAKDTKKQRSFSISGARHAVSSLDVSLGNHHLNESPANKVGSRVSISDFKNSLFRGHKSSRPTRDV